MPNGINIGDWVRTPYGEGEVVELIGDYARVRVNDAIINQYLNRLRTISRNTRISRTLKPEIVDNLETDKNKIVNLRTLESLRFGLVPQEKIEDLTIGYEGLKEWTNELLPHNNQNRPKVGGVIGNYGTGKSHTLSVIRHIAKKSNYVTANIEVDGVRVRLSDPETFLSAVWTQLEAENLCSATPLLEIYLKAIRNGMSAPRIAVSGVDRINHNYDVIKFVLNKNCLDELEEELNAIVSSYTEFTATEVTRLLRDTTGNPFQYVRRMIGRDVDERPYDFIESLFGHSEVCRLAGYRGLIITIDEFEIQEFDHYNKRAIILLDLLRQYLSGQTRYRSFPCTLIFGQVPDSGNRLNQYIDTVINESEGITKTIEEINEENCLQLAEKIFNIYKSVYLENNVVFNKDKAKVSYKRVGNSSGRVRAFIKDYIASLDNEFFNQ